MTNLTNPKQWLVLLVLSLASFTCHAQQSKAEQDLAELRTWVNDLVNKAGEATRQERVQLKQEFDRLSAKVEQGVDRLSERSKGELKDLRGKYHQWEAQQQERASIYLDPAELQRRIELLLGPHRQIRSLEGPQMREAYATFMTNVRAQRRTWDQEDWAYAEEVLGLLNDRRDRVDATLSTGDRLKIQAMKAEFSTLRASRDAREVTREKK